MTFEEFMGAFRGECLRRKWGKDLVPSEEEMRSELRRDECVIWVGNDSLWYFDWRRHSKSI